MYFRVRVISLLLLIVSLVGFVSCEDEVLEALLEDGLPDREAVVSAQVNGELVEFGSFNFSFKQDDEQLKEYLGWEISMLTYDRSCHVKINVYPAELNLGTYNFNDPRYNFELEYYTPQGGGALEIGNKFVANQGYFKILSIDYEKGKISGVFVARLYNEDKSQIISLRGGSFTNAYYSLD